jgi:hypothetical protein
MTPLTASPRWTIALTSVAFFMVALDALVVGGGRPVDRRRLQRPGRSTSTAGPSHRHRAGRRRAGQGSLTSLPYRTRLCEEVVESLPAVAPDAKTERSGRLS